MLLLGYFSLVIPQPDQMEVVEVDHSKWLQLLVESEGEVGLHSPQVKRGPDGNAEEDGNGYRRQGRPMNLNRSATAGASKVVVEEFGALQPSLQYYIGNTPGKANEEAIRKVLERCAAALLDDERGQLVIESVHCLTKETDPRTKCWRVVVPPRYKDIMENSELYPEGWRFREFVGIFRNSSRTAEG